MTTFQTRTRREARKWKRRAASAIFRALGRQRATGALTHEVQVYRLLRAWCSRQTDCTRFQLCEKCVERHQTFHNVMAVDLRTNAVHDEIKEIWCVVHSLHHDEITLTKIEDVLVSRIRVFAVVNAVHAEVHLVDCFFRFSVAS